MSVASYFLFIFSAYHFIHYDGSSFQRVFMGQHLCVLKGLKTDVEVNGPGLLLFVQLQILKYLVMPFEKLLKFIFLWIVLRLLPSATLS